MLWLDWAEEWGKKLHRSSRSQKNPYAFLVVGVLHALVIRGLFIVIFSYGLYVSVLPRGEVLAQFFVSVVVVFATTHLLRMLMSAHWAIWFEWERRQNYLYRFVAKFLLGRKEYAA